MNATTTEVSEIDQLAFDLEAAKTHELHAKEARLAIEEKIVSLMEKKEEGTVSTKTEFYKVSVTFGVDRKVDAEIARSLADEMDAERYARVFRWKPEVSVSELKYLKDNNPEVFRQVSRALTAKPTKPSVKVEEIKR